MTIENLQSIFSILILAFFKTLSSWTKVGKRKNSYYYHNFLLIIWKKNRHSNLFWVTI